MIIEKFSKFDPSKINESKETKTDKQLCEEKCNKLEAKLCKKLEKCGKCKISCSEKRGKTICDITVKCDDDLTIAKATEISRSISTICGKGCKLKSSSGSGKTAKYVVECC